MALAAVAAVIGLVCSAIVGVTLIRSLGTTQFHEGHDFEARILQLGKANRHLMHALEGLTAGRLAGRPEQSVVRAVWHDFEQNLIEVCNALAPTVPNLDRLRQTCRSSEEARAIAGPELLMFDPPARPLAPSVLKQLQGLRADIEGLTEYVLARTGELENELAQDYRRAMLVLAVSTTGFVLAALVLLYLVSRASVQHFSKWQDATLQHARLDSIVGSSGAPIVVVDPDLQIVLGNREFYSLRGNAHF